MVTDMKAYERLLRYVRIGTTSDPESPSHPSSQNQFELANILAQELRELGLGDAFVDENCLVYAHLQATDGREREKAVGFIAHMDTAPDFSGEGVNPLLHFEYDGGDVALGNSGKTLSPEVFPHLKTLVGRTLITSDGTTLLGADDKAGIAEIMTMLERIKDEKLSHGKLCICFTPDEEVGKGTDCFDFEKFGADFAYTVDGGEEGEVVYENFNAASAMVTFEGVNVHTGSACGVMVNAAALAAEFAERMPKDEVPEKTKGYEGFFHLCGMSGDVEHAELSYLVRDHDREHFEGRKELLREMVRQTNEKLGAERVLLTLQDSYYNMEEKIRPVFYIVERALDAVKKTGLEPIVTPIRGGTDGARLSYAGLPTPNLGTGGYAFHGPYEHITAEGMDLSTEILLKIAVM